LFITRLLLARTLLAGLVPVVMTSSLLWSVPGNAQICVDTDGDGWGWDGQDTCIVPQTGGTAAPDNACIDNDGDGYGWDGNDTCLVSSPAAQVPATSTPSSVAGLCVDDDGDGWGWNGVDSCVVGATQPAPGQPVTPSTPVVQAPQIGNSAFDPQRDLVAIHFDHAPDRDDGHAAVAALMVRDKLGLNVQVVAGTYGVYSASRYDAESERVMAAVWGSEWLNAHSNRNGSIDAAVNRWTSTLAGGGSVWVAEGGPSDFTAEVVRRIQRNHSEFNTRQRIHVIQHSDWNEDHALAADLNYTRNNTRYVKINDGNDPNSTADFRFESNINGAFVTRAQSSSYASQWGVAFNYLTPADKLDFSDNVEIMHIVGLGVSVIRDVNEFGDYFF